MIDLPDELPSLLEAAIQQDNRPERCRGRKNDRRQRNQREDRRRGCCASTFQLATAIDQLRLIAFNMLPPKSFEKQPKDVSPIHWSARRYRRFTVASAVHSQQPPMFSTACAMQMCRTCLRKHRALPMTMVRDAQIRQKRW